MKAWERVRDEGGLSFISHSGGKDSQAMYLHLCLDLRIPEHQIVVVHSHLGEVEWPGVMEHIEATTVHQLNVVRAEDKDCNLKTFMSMVARRGMWPSPKHRQCTSDLKRGPIYKFIRQEMKRRGCTLAVNCMGLRAQESSSRAKKPAEALNKKLSKAGREVYEWLPIHDWTTERVFERIAQAHQRPHFAYRFGNDRLSCVFCIMGSPSDHRNGARFNPDLYATLVQREQDMGHTMFPEAGLEKRNDFTVAEARLAHVELIAAINIGDL